MDSMKIADLRERAARLPRVDLFPKPTPLHRCPRFSEALGNGVNVWLKREDMTMAGFGGNKVRKLEFTMGRIKAEGYDTAVFGLAGQSNYCRQLAAVCAAQGVPCHLVLRKDHKADGPLQGNLLMDHVFGAEVTMVAHREGEATTGPEASIRLRERQAAALKELMERLKAEGRKPYRLGRADEVLGAVAFALCLAEIVEQLAAAGAIPDYVCATGYSGTGAGLLLGKRVLGFPGEVLGFCPSPGVPDLDETARTATDAAALLGYGEKFTREDLRNTSDYGGPEYGLPNEGCLEAIALMGRTEGIILGPVYTGKGMAGVIDSVRKGVIPAGATVVFLHTGGTPEFFTYNVEVAEHLLKATRNAEL